jgi:hypothetical protein
VQLAGGGGGGRNEVSREQEGVGCCPVGLQGCLKLDILVCLGLTQDRDRTAVAIVEEAGVAIVSVICTYVRGIYLTNSSADCAQVWAKALSYSYMSRGVLAYRENNKQTIFNVRVQDLKLTVGSVLAQLDIRRHTRVPCPVMSLSALT